MGKYILRRLVISVLTLWLLATASFFLLRVLPGNPFQTEKLLTLEMQQKMIHYYGLDKPMLEQYVTYMGNLLHGDMGYSMKFTNRTVNSIITSGFPVSAALGLRALAVALPIGLFLGILSARKRGKALDYLAVLVSVTIGIYVGGLIGGVIAIPIAGTVKVFADDYLSRKRSTQAADDKPIAKFVKKVTKRKSSTA